VSNSSTPSTPSSRQIPAGSADALKADELIEKMQNPNETFDFFTNSAFITKYTGAEFGEGAAAVKRLLHEVDLDKEFADITSEMREVSGQRQRNSRSALKRSRLSVIAIRSRSGWFST
jgi:hypothetical protein